MRGCRIGPGETDAVGEAQERLHRGYVGVDGRRPDGRAAFLGPHRGQCGLHVFHCRFAQIDASRREGAQEAFSDALIDFDCMRRAILMALREPLNSTLGQWRQ